MKNLFGEEPEPHIAFPLKKRCTAGTCGKGPAGETCGTCRHFCRVRPGQGTFFKCGLMRHHWTHGAATDIRFRWEACEYWESEAAALLKEIDDLCNEMERK